MSQQKQQKPNYRCAYEGELPELHKGQPSDDDAAAAADDDSVDNEHEVEDEHEDKYQDREVLTIANHFDDNGDDIAEIFIY